MRWVALLRPALLVSVALAGCDDGRVTRIVGDGQVLRHDVMTPPASDGPGPASDAPGRPDLPSGPGCTNQEAYLDGHCYRAVGMGVMTYEMARTSCEALGSVPVSIESAEENQLVFDLLYMWTSCGWIGLIREGGGHAWVDGTPVTYTNWQSGEPDSETCTCLRGPAAETAVQGQWRDARCGTELREIVCERVP